jgi:hypothetical protein
MISIAAAVTIWGAASNSSDNPSATTSTATTR